MSERNFATQELKTEAGKVLAVFKVDGTSLYNIGFTSGGQVPAELLGAWTDPVMAQKAIKVYLQNRPKQVDVPKNIEAFTPPPVKVETKAPVAKKKTSKKKAKKKQTKVKETK